MAKTIPVPELILFMLRNIMGWQSHGHGEKVRWSVHGSVEGEPVGFELRKFGFTILQCKKSKVPTSRIVGQLRSALNNVEEFLTDFAKTQVEGGEVLIANRFGEFDARYRFFRKQANRAYSKADQPHSKKLKNKPKDEEFPFDLADRWNHAHSANRKGFFHSTAMVDAYFSALEHRLVLLRAFTGLPMASGELQQVLKSNWYDKLKAVLPTNANEETETLIASLRRIKERIRNPFAHGGVENDGGSLFFKLPSVGAIPANFSKFGDSVRFSFLPIEVEDHAGCCAIFDAVDKLLSHGMLNGPHKFLDAGVEPSFDTKTLELYATACISGEEAIDKFIDRWWHEWERHANMDY